MKPPEQMSDRELEKAIKDANSPATFAGGFSDYTALLRERNDRLGRNAHCSSLRASVDMIQR